jgi:hypothetical protein
VPRSVRCSTGIRGNDDDDTAGAHIRPDRLRFLGVLGALARTRRVSRGEWIIAVLFVIVAAIALWALYSKT